MSKMIFVYLIFPAALIALFLLSKDLEIPETMEETGISRVFLKMSLFIYQKVRGRIKSFSGEKIRQSLATLQQRKDLDTAETEYFIRKISIVLIMATAGSFLSIMMCLGAGKSSHITNEGAIERGEFGDREFELELVAADETGKELLDYTLPVRTRAYTKEEAEDLFEKAGPVLERIVLKDNESFDRVTTDLDLVESIPEYPFTISWKMDNYEIVHLDGALNEDSIPKEGTAVTLTAIYSYEEMKWQQEFVANILPRVLSPAERAFKEIKKLLLQADQDSLTEGELVLPKEYEGRKLFWSERKEDNSLMLLLLTLIGGAASYVMKDKELKKAMEQRYSQMLSDYPQFVSQLVLYMGAGMTMRNILIKLSANYDRKKKAGDEKRYLYEEVQRASRELSAGESEADVYVRLGLRCGGQQYTRLVTLLSQNLRKGNSELLALLQEESKKAFEERMDKARKAGEEAGTKLLFPMIIMLVIVMVVIMIPAYMAF